MSDSLITSYINTFFSRSLVQILNDNNALQNFHQLLHHIFNMHTVSCKLTGFSWLLISYLCRFKMRPNHFISIMAYGLCLVSLMLMAASPALADCCSNPFSGCSGVGECNIFCCNCDGGCASDPNNELECLACE